MDAGNKSAFVLFAVSIRKVRPVITKAWGATKSYISDTKLRPAVNNKIITNIEIAMDNGVRFAEIKLQDLGDKMLPSELKYLEDEIRKLKKRMTETSSYVDSRK